VNKKRLGRGLAALLGTEEGGFEAGSLELADLIHVAVDMVDPNPFQPRREFDAAEIAALADSLRQHGMLQPIIIRQVGERFQLIAGERRLRAAVEANLHEVPARVLELDDQRVSELAMVENLQRTDLNPLEKATAFRSYLDRFGGTKEELAARLGLERSTISNLLRLLDLPEKIQEAVRVKKISQGHARALVTIEDRERQHSYCLRVIQEGLSVRQTEALVQRGEPTPALTRVRKDPPQPAIEQAPHFEQLEAAIRDRFGTPVTIRYTHREHGRIIIEFNSHDDFARITSMLCAGISLPPMPA
jgi:ParB family chromosome partitioning protein